MVNSLPPKTILFPCSLFCPTMSWYSSPCTCHGCTSLDVLHCTSMAVLHSIKNTKTCSVGQPFRDLKTVAAHALKPLLKCLLHIRTCRFLPWNMQTMEYGSVTSPSLMSASNIYLTVSSGSDSNTPEMIAISCYNLPLHIQRITCLIFKIPMLTSTIIITAASIYWA